MSDFAEQVARLSAAVDRLERDAGGVERRAQVDAETVKALLLVHGGSAAALTAMLPNTLQTADFRVLAIAMVAAIACNLIGLTAAVIHNRLRRKCSLEYAKAVARRDAPYKNKWLKKCWSVPNEPALCTRSVIWMWVSILFFVFTSTSVIVGGFRIIGVELRSPAECWEVRETGSGFVRVDKCTGQVVPLSQSEAAQSVPARPIY